MQCLNNRNVLWVYFCVSGLARRVGAKILIASTSEVYGDPMVHPQPESYWGHVNPIGKNCIWVQFNFKNLDIF